MPERGSLGSRAAALNAPAYGSCNPPCCGESFGRTVSDAGAGRGIVTKVPKARKSPKRESASTTVSPGGVEVTSDEAAQVLVKHLFAPNATTVPGLSYAALYKLAQGKTGGDIVDLYHFDNDEVAIVIADIAGKGPQAAIHAALIKYALRAYSSAGMTPERVVRALDRLYLENNAFEKHDSFASVFFGIVDPTRRLMHYACAGHEPIILFSPNGNATQLAPTAPLVGVFDDQHHLFKQSFVELPKNCLFLAATDGVTEARNAKGDLYGMDRLIDLVRKKLDRPEKEIVAKVLSDVERFCKGRRRDDIALLAVRTL